VPVNLRLVVVGAARLDAALAGMGRRCSDLSPLFELVIDQELIPEESEQFESEGRGRWKPLSPAYARRKARIYGDKPILQAEGSLVESLTRRGAPGQVRDVRETEAYFGTTLPYARFHQTGTQRMPMRQVFDVTQERVERIGKRQTDYFRGVSRAEGFEVL
jgi:phage gpG-like protein